MNTGKQQVPERDAQAISWLGLPPKAKTPKKYSRGTEERLALKRTIQAKDILDTVIEIMPGPQVVWEGGASLGEAGGLDCQSLP